MPVVSVIPWWRHQMETLPRYWPFVRRIHRPPVNSPHKGQWRGALIFFICASINGWVNNRGAGDVRCLRANIDVILMHCQGKYHRLVMKRLPLVHDRAITLSPCAQEIPQYCIKTLFWKNSPPSSKVLYKYQSYFGRNSWRIAPCYVTADESIKLVLLISCGYKATSYICS